MSGGATNGNRINEKKKINKQKQMDKEYWRKTKITNNHKPKTIISFGYLISDIHYTTFIADPWTIFYLHVRFGSSLLAYAIYGIGSNELFILTFVCYTD